MLLDADALPLQPFGADVHAVRKPQIDGTGMVVAVGEIHVRLPLFVLGKPGDDQVKLAPAHLLEQGAEGQRLDRAGTAHGFAQRLSDFGVEPGLSAFYGKGKGRIIVFHADAEGFLGPAARREARGQQREEEHSQQDGPARGRKRRYHDLQRKLSWGTVPARFPFLGGEHGTLHCDALVFKGEKAFLRTCCGKPRQADRKNGGTLAPENRGSAARRNRRRAPSAPDLARYAASGSDGWGRPLFSMRGLPFSKGYSGPLQSVLGEE